MKLAVVGGGWAGCAAAVRAVQRGHPVTLFEASRDWGGRSRTLRTDPTLDNGQHILLGAYTTTLDLMRTVGVDPHTCLLRQPLDLRLADGRGLHLPPWPAPWDAAWGMLRARGWSWRNKLQLLATTAGWRRNGFSCGTDTTVEQLCHQLAPVLRQTLIDPLCLAALNTPPEQASARVFLRVLHDALLGFPGSSHLLLPTAGLGTLFPEPAVAWLQAQGAVVRPATRVQALHHTGSSAAGSWQVDGEAFDQVVLACPPWEALRLVADVLPALEGPSASAHSWLAQAQSLRHEAITTVYLQAPGLRLARPMLALPSDHDNPAQFVFDRGQLGGPAGLLALVVSASQGDAAAVERQALAQARHQLGVQQVDAVRTITEKRATFACTADARRPGTRVYPGLLACGDYIDGPYPATLEGAVRSAQEAVALC